MRKRRELPNESLPDLDTLNRLRPALSIVCQAPDDTAPVRDCDNPSRGHARREPRTRILDLPLVRIMGGARRTPQVAANLVDDGMCQFELDDFVSVAPQLRVLSTLNRRGSLLSSAAQQRQILASAPLRKTFEQALLRAKEESLSANSVGVLQINVGKKCNQTCHHCHVDAGPDRKEVMSDDVVEACLALVETGRVRTVDITGGAPELHPRFREMVERSVRAGAEVMDRCNLTILQTKSHAGLIDFFVRHRVQVVASLPWYSESRTDSQRGAGVFEASLAALRRLNEAGYGSPGSGLELNLVTNPEGQHLFDNPQCVEQHYKGELWQRHGIRFNHLFTMTNMPISRFLEQLTDSNQLEGYLDKLLRAFNPAAVAGLMCRFTLSVGYDGRLYDCDFNQMLELELPQTIFDLNVDELSSRRIRTGAHCFGCTAGQGSSCGGATV